MTLFDALLRCYPPSFRRAHGVEFRQFVRMELARGVPRATLVRDAAGGALREWIDVLKLPPGEPMRNLVRDLRHAARLLLKSPGFTLAAVLTLALGIGANTAMFTLADATLLRPVHVAKPHELVVWSWTSSYPDYQEYAKRTDVFQGVLGIGGLARVSVRSGDSLELVRATFVTGNAFDVLGVRAVLGRTLRPSDEVANGPIVVVLSHDYWQTRHGGDPGVVGRSVHLNGRPATVVGVIEKGFRGLTLVENAAMFVPTASIASVSTGGFWSRFDPLTARNMVWIRVIGRMRPDVTVEQASSTMGALYEQLNGPPRAGRTREPLRLKTVPVRALGENADDVRAFVTLLVGVATLTLLVGCANLANLLLAKSTVRRRETGVRLALGATRGRVLQQALAETLLLSVTGGIGGLAVARGTLALLSSYQLPGGIPILGMHLDVDGRALLATTALSLLTGLIFGALPAWRASRTDVLSSLREQSRGVMSRSHARSVLLGVQVALSVVLLAGSGLFARALMAALDTPPGFDARGVVTASVNLGLARYEPGRASQFYGEALDRVKALPGVTSAAWADLVPTRGLFRGVVEIDGYTPAAGEDVTVNGSHVGPDFFATMGTRVLSGREFSATDVAAAPRVAIVNDAMARAYWPGRSALGGRVKMFDEWLTVVGVVETTVTVALREAPRPQVYLPFDQWLQAGMGIALDAAHLVIRTSAPVEPLMPLVRDRIRSVDPNVPLFDISAFEARVATLVMPQRLGVLLFTLYSALALTLATVGIYGVASYVAALRTREIGLRIALGASGSAVRRLILREGARPVVAGITIGLALALYASRLVEAFLHGVNRFDPLTFTTVPLLLAAIALGATYIPARRASRIAPVDALRQD